MDENRHELIAELFYLLTVAMEDGATLAVEGQAARLSADRHAELAGELRERGQAIMILSDAVLKLSARA